MRRTLLALLAVTLAGTTAASQQRVSQREAFIARAKSLEIHTPYVPPPGEALEHHTSGFAKIICSAVFVTGLDPDFAAENVGYFTSPYAERARVAKPVIDRINKAVHITLLNGVTRTAKVSWEPRVRDASNGPEHRQFHANQRQEPTAGRLDRTMAHG